MQFALRLTSYSVHPKDIYIPVTQLVTYCYCQTSLTAATAPLWPVSAAASELEPANYGKVNWNRHLKLQILWKKQAIQVTTVSCYPEWIVADLDEAMEKKSRQWLRECTNSTKTLVPCLPNWDPYHIGSEDRKELPLSHVIHFPDLLPLIISKGLKGTSSVTISQQTLFYFIFTLDR